MRVTNLMLPSSPRLCKFVAIYLNNVVIHSLTRAKHLHHMWIVLNLLKKASLKLKRSKCKLFCNEIEFGGCQINQKGLHMLDSKTKPETEWPRSPEMKEVHCILSLMSCYWNHIWRNA